MFIETLVLNGNSRINQRLGHILQRSPLAVSGGVNLLQLLNISAAIHIIKERGLFHTIVINGPVLSLRQNILLQVLTKGAYQHQTAHQYDQNNCGSRTRGNLCQRNRNRSQRIQKLQGPMGIPLLTGLLCSPSDLLFIFHKEYPPIPRPRGRAGI